MILNDFCKKSKKNYEKNRFAEIRTWIIPFANQRKIRETN